MTAPAFNVDEPRFLAAVDLIRRTGADQFQIRYSSDEAPVIWLAVAVYPENRAEAAAATTPDRAAYRLLETVVDGGECSHCKRPTGVDPDSLDAMPLNEYVCWYQFDPELETFRRGCEGDAP